MKVKFDAPALANLCQDNAYLADNLPKLIAQLEAYLATHPPSQ